MSGLILLSSHEGQLKLSAFTLTVLMLLSSLPTSLPSQFYIKCLRDFMLLKGFHFRADDGAVWI